jgi:hypothetical protein
MGREPSSRELLLLGSQLKLHGDLEPIARDLIMSEEFSLQMLPQLVAKWSTNFRGRNVFFLHVPKTAGTSVRLAIGEALGVPGFLMYGDFIEPEPSASFWPYWAGHVGISAFPKTHDGFTVFRETRSRLLSQYRQAQKRAGPAPRVALNGPRQRRAAPPPPNDFWKGGHGLDGWYFQDAKATPNDRGRAANSFLSALTSKEKSIGLERGLKRIQQASWVHQESALIAAVNRLTGASLDSIPRENTFESSNIEYSEVRLTNDDIRVLEALVDRDKTVFDIAVSLGLIPKLDKQSRDDLFIETAKRLRFVLP